jgi:TolB-like protein
MKNYLSILIIAILMIASPAFSQAKQKKTKNEPAIHNKMRLAILDLEPRGVSKVISSSVTDLLRTEMIDTGQFTVVERAQMDAIMKEQGLQQTGCTDNTCAVQVGKLLSANKILVGEVNILGQGLVITARVVDVEKGTADFASSEKAKDITILTGRRRNWRGN